jgi:hypothetical protein
MSSAVEAQGTHGRARGLYNRVFSEYQKSVIRAILLATRNPSAAIPPSLKRSAVSDDVSYSVEGEIGECRLIFATSRGLFVLDYLNGIAKRVLSGKFYGLTRYGDSWLIARSNNRGPKYRRMSDISAITLSGDQVESLKQLAIGIPGELHQIDVIEDLLYVPHTGYNQILTTSVRRLLGRTVPATILSFDNTFLDIFKPSHLNSVFYNRGDRHVRLVAHNLTAHTAKSSDLVAYDPLTGEHSVQRTESHSAHNVFTSDGETIYCDSNNRRLVRNGQTIFEADKLLRGLSITDDRMYVGGSDVDFESSRRSSSDAAIYVLDRDGRLQGTVSIPGVGNLYEIRQLSSHDYAMSSEYQPAPRGPG